MKILVGESPANDGCVFAREMTTGTVRSFPPGALRALEQEDGEPAAK